MQDTFFFQAVIFIAALTNERFTGRKLPIKGQKVLLMKKKSQYLPITFHLTVLMKVIL
jgi:SOS-response transcriptional repressor LexA